MTVCSNPGQAFDVGYMVVAGINGSPGELSQAPAECHFGGTFAVWQRWLRPAATNSVRVPDNGTGISRGRIDIDSVDR